MGQPTHSGLVLVLQVRWQRLLGCHDLLPKRRAGSASARVVKVAEILDRWPGAGHLYVKLRGSDGATYILRQDLGHGYWWLILFRNQRAVDWVG
jgi:hypothetical protein